MNKNKTKKRSSLSAFSILMIVLAVICLISIFLNGSPINSELIKSLNPSKYADLIDQVNNGEVVKVVGSKFSDFFMAIPKGFLDASDLIVFIIALGGFIGIVMKTGALESGVYHLVKKLKGREEILIIVLMIFFSIGGTTYGMAEETIGFYTLITAAMVAAGFDTMVAVGTVLLGAGSGVLGSTINPFSTGAAMSALSSVGIEPNKAVVIALGTVLWIVTLLISIIFVVRYARKVKADKGSTILSIQEQENMRKEFGTEDKKELEYTKKHKLILAVFGLAFIVMIITLIPYDSIVFGGNEEAYLNALGWTAFLTGQPIGWWYFTELAAWFILSSIIISIIAGMSEKEYIDNFMIGAAELLSVGLIIAVARGITVVMATTRIDLYILDHSSSILRGVSGLIFAPASYVVYLFLSFLVPSTSGLAGLSVPVMGGLADALGFSASVMISIFAAGIGLVNMFTPTSGVVMGGLAAARVEYSTYIKWLFKYIIVVAISNIAILSIAIIMIKK